MKFALLVVVLAAVFIHNSVAQSCYGKNVEVTVINGVDLTGDRLFRLDPYVELTIGGVSKETKVIHSSQNPFWYQAFLFKDVYSNEMKIDVWDRDSRFLGHDHHIGSCTEELTVRYNEYTHVQCNVGQKGVLNLKYKCYGNSQEEEY